MNYGDISLKTTEVRSSGTFVHLVGATVAPSGIPEDEQRSRHGAIPHPGSKSEKVD